MKKRTFYTEIAYIAGIMALALGTAFMEKADFGVSMVVAPAYLLYLKLSQFFDFMTFGIAEYTLQACLLICMIVILREFKVSYLFSFLTAVIYGLMLDCSMTIIAGLETLTFPWRIFFYLSGQLLGAAGVSFIFHTYIAPEVYELFVKKVSAKMNKDINHFKIVYDCISCLTAILMSFLFFGLFRFEGVKAGTVISAFVNGRLIALFSRHLEQHLSFTDRLPFRKYFE